MTAHQPDLFAAAGSPEHRPVVDRLVPRLLSALDSRGWVSARVLSRELNTDDRSLREAASQSAGEIVSGQRGYCLTRQASLEDVDRSTRWLLSQSARMRERAMAIERVRHGRAA